MKNMLKAHQNCLVKRLAMEKLGRSLRRYFAGIHVQGDLGALANDDRPTLYFANHLSSWDGVIANYLSYMYLRQDSFIMAREQMMVSRSTWAGLFSVNPLDRFSATQSLRYAVRLLRDVPRCALWVFPQGIPLPFHIRPLGFQKGVASILSQMKEIRLVPVVFYYTLIRHSKPEAFVSFGEPLSAVPTANLAQLTHHLEGCLIEKLDKLDSDLAHENAQSFKTLIYGKSSLRESLMRLKGNQLTPLKAWGRTPPQPVREEYQYSTSLQGTTVP
jgi:1-acyl-sn-glycerol-3-phosphate acyltransferase